MDNTSTLSMNNVHPMLPTNPIRNGEDTQHRDTFNLRFRELTHGINSLVSSLNNLNQYDANYLRNIISRTSNPAFVKDFEIPNVDSKRFTSFFNNEGETSPFNSNFVFLNCVEYGVAEKNNYFFLVFNGDGKKISQKDIYIENTQNGLGIYLRINNGNTINVKDGDTLTVLLMHKFMHYDNTPFTKFSISEETSSVTHTFDYESEAKLGNVILDNYLKVYSHSEGQEGYLPVDEFQIEINSSGERQLTIELTDSTFAADTSFIVVNTLQYGSLFLSYNYSEELGYNNIITSSEDTNLRSDDIMVDGQSHDITKIYIEHESPTMRDIPTSISNGSSLYVFVNGLKLANNQDFVVKWDAFRALYYIELAYPLFKDTYNEIQVFQAQPNTDLDLTEFFVAMPPSSVIKLSNALGLIYANNFITFSNNHYTRNSSIISLSEKHVVMHGLNTLFNIELMATPLASSALLDFVNSYLITGTEFLRMLDTNPDFEDNFITNRLKSISDKLLPNTINPNLLGFKELYGEFVISLDKTEYSTIEDQVLFNNLSASSSEIVGNVTFSLDTSPTNGSVYISSNGSFTYTPNSNFFGKDVFSVKLSTDSFIERIQDVTVNISSVDDPTVINKTSFITQEDTDIEDVISYTDIDSSNIIFMINDYPSHGNLSLFSNGSFIYSPDVNYSGSDNFEVRITDDEGNVKIGQISITIEPVNDAPFAKKTIFKVSKNTPMSGFIDPIDVEGDPFVPILTQTTEFGTLVFSNTGRFEYTPNQNFIGLDQFKVRISDTRSASKIETIMLNVGSLPVLETDSFTSTEDTVLNGTLVGSGITGGEVIFSVERLTKNGSIEMQSDGNFVYVPNTNFVGVDSFNVLLIDEAGFTLLATVSITVSPDNDIPVIKTPYFVMNSNETLTGDLLIADPENDTFSVSLINGATNGFINSSVPFAGFTYEPNLDFIGRDTFTVRVTDDRSGKYRDSVIIIFVGLATDVDFLNQSSYMTEINGNLTIANANPIGQNLVLNSNHQMNITSNMVFDSNTDLSLPRNVYMDSNLVFDPNIISGTVDTPS